MQTERIMSEIIICMDCESEFKISELHSDYEISFCPYCGTQLETEEE